MIELIKIEQIKQELDTKGQLLIEYDFDAFDENYFNELVKELTDFKVSEIRPCQKIWITKGINTDILYTKLNQLVLHIISYNKIRTEVFNEFLSSLGIDKIEGEFYKLRIKLQSQNAWPKGEFKDWNYWSHGGDIEFDNTENGSHFNIRMSNINSIKPWSIHRYLKGITPKSEESKFIVEHKEEIPRMLDLLVLQNELKAIRTPFGEKQYQLENKGT